jgi:hypothetical protein
VNSSRYKHLSATLNKLEASGALYPTIEALHAARVEFERLDPHDVFYRAATELVERAVNRDSDLSVTEAVAVLLKTWNAGRYRYGTAKFDEQHFTDINDLLTRNTDALQQYRRRNIYGFQDEQDGDHIAGLFQDFERVLGKVGAAKHSTCWRQTSFRSGTLRSHVGTASHLEESAKTEIGIAFS